MVLTVFSISLSSINGQEANQKHDSSQKQRNIDYGRQILRNQISSMMGVGCDTVLLKSLIEKISSPDSLDRIGAIALKDTAQGPSKANPSGYNLNNLPQYYPFYVSPTGNDNNSGSMQSPFRTIQKAINMAQAGYAIKIGNGVYNESIRIQSKDIYLVGNLECPESVIINAENFSSGVSIYGCSPELHGMTISGAYRGIYMMSAYPKLSHLILTANDEAICSLFDGFLLYNSLIYANNSTYPTINMDSYSNSYSYADICNVTIAYNTGSSAIHSGAYTNFNITNSIIYNPNITTEVTRDASPNIIYVEYSNIRNLQQGQASIGSGVINVNPSFVNVAALDFRLMPSSPCVDTGKPDFYDRQRPPGLGTIRSDMGAYGWEARMSAPCITAGDDRFHPIYLGYFNYNFTVSDTRQVQDFTNQFITPSGNDIFYRIDLGQVTDLVISHCGSTHSDTWLALLDKYGTVIASNDNYTGSGQCSSTLHARLELYNIPEGKYYVVSKARNGNSGAITTNIQGFYAGIGDRITNPFIAGTFSDSFQYNSDPQNTNNFTNQYTGQPTNDVYYRFTITKKMQVTMTHKNSALTNTYI